MMRRFLKNLAVGRDKPGVMDLPLEQRYDNPNNMVRRAIRYANLLASKNDLDFIVMTGDLIDFALRPENVFSIMDLDYEKTNWVHFLDIMLNRVIEPKPGTELTGIEPNEELLVPFFCIPGNHDYRVTHYSLTSLGIYKKLRLKGYEAWNYSDGNPALAPLLVTKDALQGYYQNVNPYHDFYL